MIYLMRHGQDNEDYIGGWSDLSLIEKGIVEVNERRLCRCCLGEKGPAWTLLVHS